MNLTVLKYLNIFDWWFILSFKLNFIVNAMLYEIIGTDVKAYNKYIFKYK